MRIHLFSPHFFSVVAFTMIFIPNTYSQTPVIPLVPEKLNLDKPADQPADTTAATTQASIARESLQKTDSQNVNIPVNNITPQSPAAISLKKSWSYSLPMSISGITICDINNDKLMETVIISENQLLVFQFKNKTFTQIANYTAFRGTHFLSIDAADFNKNGIPEIFITACNSTYNSLTSSIGEFENNKFKLLKKRIPLFLRVVQNSDSSQIILSQDFSEKGVNYGKVHLLNPTDYSAHEQVSFPRDHSILSVSSYVNNQDKTFYFLCYGSKGNIELLDNTSFQSQAESEVKYSGNPEYLLLPSNDVTTQDRSYLPIRTLSADINGDNKTEIIAIKNHELTNGILQSIKYYVKYHIEILLQSNGSALTSVWTSPNNNGYISDCTFGDYNNDGKKEVVLIKVVKSSDIAFRKPLSEITAFTAQ